MVAIISVGRSLRATLNYNENKLFEKKATLIHSANFGKDTQQLTFNDKFRRLQHLAALNNRVEVNSVHISLNFDPSEKLNHATLSAIADKYMQGIGYAHQPYLVYEHTDSGHPHIHIVTTNIQQSGIRIPSNNIGKNKSEKIRKSIEQEYNLVKAERQRLVPDYEIKPVNAQKVIYGKSETKRAIANVLKQVLPKYKYTSLSELNAVLKQYNILADRGNKDSRVYKTGGLVYRVLDSKGEKVGVPVKASAIYFKPTLSRITERFENNEHLREPHKQRVKNSISLALARRDGTTLSSLMQELQKEGINLHIHQNAQGRVYGLTYIDHDSKCVFKGSDLGKQYSAVGILQRLQVQLIKQQLSIPAQKQHIQLLPVTTQSTTISNNVGTYTPVILPSNIHLSTAILEALFEPEYQGTLNPELREEKTKKQKRRISHHE